MTKKKKDQELRDSFEFVNRYGVSGSPTILLGQEMEPYLNEIEKRRADYLGGKQTSLMNQAYYLREAVLRIHEVNTETSTRVARAFATSIYGDKLGLELFKNSQNPEARKRLSDEAQMGR